MSGVSYSSRDDGWFATRVLRRHARVPHLWAMGVGAVISGDFFGWNFGFQAGGFGGLMVALGVVTLLYIGLSFSLAEMSPALPHAGGAYSFARTAMGPMAGYVTGLAENMEYIFTPATIVVGAGGYLGAIFGTPAQFAPLWWLACYVVFVGLNIHGVELSFQVCVWITLCALAVLAIFYAGALPLVDFERWALAGGPFLPKGSSGVLAALPFAIWVYLGIEQLPLSAEETHDPGRDLPKGILLALATLIVCSFATPALSGAIAPGAAAIATSTEPLLAGFRTIFGANAWSKLLAAFACTGLIASFHAIIYAYGRQIFSLSRSGYFPEWLSAIHRTRRTPVRALVVGAAIGYGAALVIWAAGENSAVGAVLLNMAVFGAVIAYVFQMVSFIILRVRFPKIARPYRSPLGVAGAAMAAVLSAVTLVALFQNPDYRRGVWGAAVWFACGVLYFVGYARKRLILAPEEAFAIAVESEAEAAGE
ncbi:MAG: amino acid permease [Acidobacteria bacterium]|nr:amino acid permease [Acidobacteriota bacterium]